MPLARPEIRIAGDDRPLVGGRDEVDSPAELLVRGRASRCVEVADGAHAADPKPLADTALANLADHERSVLVCIELPRNEDRVRLAGEGRTEEAVVQLGDPPAELRASPRRSGDGAERAHAAPALELAERPDRHFLQTDDPGLVRSDELDHLAQVGAPLGRARVPVEEIPAPNE